MNGTAAPPEQPASHADCTRADASHGPNIQNEFISSVGCVCLWMIGELGSDYQYSVADDLVSFFEVYSPVSVMSQISGEPFGRCLDSFTFELTAQLQVCTVLLKCWV